MRKSRRKVKNDEHYKKDCYWNYSLFEILKLYWIPLKRKSRAGVEYIYYKKVVDKIGLKK